MDGKKNDGSAWSIINMLIGLALFIIAFLAWSRTKQLYPNIDKSCVDQAARDSVYNGIRTIGGYTFLLWVVPLVLSLISVIVFLARSGQAKKEAAALEADNDYGYGRKRPVVVDTAGTAYRCELPKYRSLY